MQPGFKGGDKKALGAPPVVNTPDACPHTILVSFNFNPVNSTIYSLYFIAVDAKQVNIFCSYKMVLSAHLGRAY